MKPVGLYIRINHHEFNETLHSHDCVPSYLGDGKNLDLINDVFDLHCIKPISNDNDRFVLFTTHTCHYSMHALALHIASFAPYVKLNESQLLMSPYHLSYPWGREETSVSRSMT